MLEKQDLEQIRGLMVEVVKGTVTEIVEDKVTSIVEEKVTEIVEDKVTSIVEEKVTEIVEDKVTQSGNMILEEIDRVQGILQQNIKIVEKNLEELQQYYRITKLENDNAMLLLKLVDELSRRVTELENKTA